MRKRKRRLKYFIPFIIILFYILFICLVPVSFNNFDYNYVRGAHRGSSLDNLENSKEAILQALNDDKYQFIEFDVFYTKEKDIIVLHDKQLLLLEKKLGIQEPLSYQYYKNQTNNQVSTYEEIIKILEGKKKINVEIKHSGNISWDIELAEFIVKDLKKRKILKDTLLSSPIDEVLIYLKENYPEVKTAKVQLFNFAHFIPTEENMNNFYEYLNNLSVDYVSLYYSAMIYSDIFFKYKPENISLGFWYFTDEFYIVKDDPQSDLW